jgi:hypothetical protein
LPITGHIHMTYRMQVPAHYVCMYRLYVHAIEMYVCININSSVSQIKYENSDRGTKLTLT